MKGYSVGLNNGDKELPKKDTNQHQLASCVESHSLVQSTTEFRNDSKKTLSMDKKIHLLDGGTFHKKSMGPVMTKHDQSPSSTCKQCLQEGPDFLKRSHSTNASTNYVINWKTCKLKHKNQELNQELKLRDDIYRDFPNKYDTSRNHHKSAELSSSRSSYCDDASSTVGDISPLLPQPTNHNRETYENYAAVSIDSISSSIPRNTPNFHPSFDIDSLSVTGDDYSTVPRISKMNDPEYKKNKSTKPQTNVKPCSKSDNKEIDSVLQLTQRLSTIQVSKKPQNNGKHFFKPMAKLLSSNNREDRKTFKDESKSNLTYRSSFTEEKAYDELVDKRRNNNLTRFDEYSGEFLKHRTNRARHHSSISDSENLLPLSDKSVFKENMIISRSDGSEVQHIDDELKFYAKNKDTCREKSNSCEGTELQRSHKLLFRNIDSRSIITTSSRSLPTPTSLECRSSKMALQRQISTPLPNFSNFSTKCSTELTICDSSDQGPPLPAKTGSRSNLSSPLYNLEEQSSSLNRLMRNETMSPLSLPPPMPHRTLHTKHSTNNMLTHTCNTNNFNSHTILQDGPNVVPPLPLRQMIFNNLNKNPPLPPKNIHTTSPAHKFLTLNGAERSHREENDIAEERSISSDSSNCTSSKESVGPEGCPDSCLWKQSFPAEPESRNNPLTTFKLKIPKTNSCKSPNILQEGHFQVIINEDLIEEVNKPMPGRYETSDSLVYEEVENFADNRNMNMMTNAINHLKKVFTWISINDLECALGKNNQNLQDTIKYLKVKCLMDLGLGDEEQCLEALIIYQWNLNEAISFLTTPQQQRQHRPLIQDPMEV